MKEVDGEVRARGLAQTVVSVRIGDLRAADQRYRFTVGEADEDLRRSIQTWGCLVPPLCIKAPDGVVGVAGFKRLQVMTAWLPPDTEVEIRLLRSGTSLLALLGLAAADTRRDREPTPFEIMRACRLALSSGHSRAEVAADLLPAFGVEPHEVVVKRHLKLATTPLPLITRLERAGVSLKRALAFVRITSDEAERLILLAEAVGMSARSLELTSKMLAEIAKREDQPWARVIERLGLMGVATDPDLPRAERSQRIQGRLWGARYPVWGTARQRVEGLIGALALPSHIHIEWDDRFEREGLSLRLEVRQVDQLRQDLSLLRAEPTIQGLQSLLDAL